jgi:hypothetical protein
MSKVVGWKLQHRFHDEQKNYLGYGEVQGRVISTCWVLFIMSHVHNNKKSRMHQMV